MAQLMKQTNNHESITHVQFETNSTYILINNKSMLRGMNQWCKNDWANH